MSRYGCATLLSKQLSGTLPKNDRGDIETQGAQLLFRPSCGSQTHDWSRDKPFTNASMGPAIMGSSYLRGIIWTAFPVITSSSCLRGHLGGLGGYNSQFHALRGHLGSLCGYNGQFHALRGHLGGICGYNGQFHALRDIIWAAFAAISCLSLLWMEIYFHLPHIGTHSAVLSSLLLASAFTTDLSRTFPPRYTWAASRNLCGNIVLLQMSENTAVKIFYFLICFLLPRVP